MPLSSPVEVFRRAPSVTTWTRLEPQPRAASMQRSLQAQVRDPLWFLTRQWQVGEFLGDDAGSPVQATLSVEQRGLTTYRPGPGGASLAPLDPGLPVEVQAEREAVALRLRGAVRSGLYFEQLLSRGGVAGAAAVIAAFRQAFPIAGAPPDPALADADGRRFRALAAGRVADGEAIYAAALAAAAGQAPPRPLPAEAAEPAVAAVLRDFVAYRQSLFSVPARAASWQPERLTYDFALGSPAPGAAAPSPPAPGAAAQSSAAPGAPAPGTPAAGSTTVGSPASAGSSPAPAGGLSLHAADFPGGHLDWYSFDLEATSGQPPPDPVAAAHPAPIATTDLNFLPRRVVFRGMPDPRWWNFEDAVTDLGQLAADTVDLAKLLVMEFALVYGNDWFLVPVPTPIGTLARVTSLVVTDTFGVRTSIRPAEPTAVAAGDSPWCMFKLSGAGSRSDFILMAPTLGLAADAEPLEEVLFLRDDMAAMAWAIEQRLQGDLDAPIDAYAMALQRQAGAPAPPVPPTPAAPPSPTPAPAPAGPRLAYALEAAAPDNWIPMVPVQSPQGELFLRRGRLETLTGSSAGVPARAVLLEPQQPFLVADRVVPRAGARVERRFRRARAADGSTFVWLARQSTPGRGPDWSGLRFDAVRDLDET